MDIHVILWAVFGVSVLVMLALDLLVFHRREHEVKLGEALIWSAVWIVLALLFNLLVLFWLGPSQALRFFTAYIVEKSLSVDNLFVFLLIFSYFGVPAAYQHKVLFWGIMGALVMRGVFIVSGIALIHYFHWTLYIFGAFLLFTAVKLATGTAKKVDPERNIFFRLFRRFFPIAEEYHEGKFVVFKSKRLMATPLLLVLLVIESSDLMFAVDSIPAVLGISTDPFIVFSSNIFAILGLRALYFALAGVMKLFHYLQYGLTAIFAFIGIKMIATDLFQVPTAVSLAVIVGVLLVSVLASVIWPARKERAAHVD